MLWPGAEMPRAFCLRGATMGRQLHRAAAFVPIAAFAVFICTQLMFTHFSHSNLTGVQAVDSDLAQYKLARIQLQWMAAMAAFVFVAVVAVVCFWIDLLTHRRNEDRTFDWRYSEAVRVACGAGFVVLCVVSISFLHNDDGRTYAHLGTALFEATLEICSKVKPCFGGTTAIDGYDRLLLLGSTTAICGVAACTVGSALSLSRKKGGVYTAEAMRHARFYLYLSSALLSFGILAMMAWMRLPLGVIENPDQAQAYEDHVKSVILFWGVAYSLVILSYHLPTMLTLQIAGVVPEPSESGQPPTIVGTSVVGSMKDTVYASFALLAPTLLPLSAELGSNILSVFTGG